MEDYTPVFELGIVKRDSGNYIVLTPKYKEDISITTWTIASMMTVLSGFAIDKIKDDESQIVAETQIQQLYAKMMDERYEYMLDSIPNEKEI